MKIKKVRENNHKKVFEVETHRGTYRFPYARLEVRPSRDDRIVKVFVDKELGSEAFTYVLESARQGTVHVDQVLDYNRDPMYLRDLMLYQMTLEAQKRVAESSLSRREIIRRLGTSPAQFYRLLDQSNYRKSIDHLLSLLQVLDCDVKFVFRERGRQSA